MRQCRAGSGFGVLEKVPVHGVVVGFGSPGPGLARAGHGAGVRSVMRGNDFGLVAAAIHGVAWVCFGSPGQAIHGRAFGRSRGGAA